MKYEEKDKKVKEQLEKK